MDEWRRIYGACGSPAGVVGNCRFIVANVPSGFEFSGQTYVSSKAVAREPYNRRSAGPRRETSLAPRGRRLTSSYWLPT